MSILWIVFQILLKEKDQRPVKEISLNLTMCAGAQMVILFIGILPFILVVHYFAAATWLAISWVSLLIAVWVVIVLAISIPGLIWILSLEA